MGGIFVVFKQKTAYELRIGDWSSDVCSSDLGRCRACDLWRDATQTVVGEGPRSAALMLVGEQPGDKEDIAGKPFVGPAGHLLDRALEAAKVERSEEPRAGNEGVSPWRSRWWPEH